jgi:hypothetical protein
MLKGIEPEILTAFCPIAMEPSRTSTVSSRQVIRPVEIRSRR